MCRKCLAEAADPAPLDAVAAVVSGLPLLSFPLAAQMATLARAMAMLPPAGYFVQFTYGPKPPLRREVMDGLGLAARRRAWVPANLPPATVYEIRRRGA